MVSKAAGASDPSGLVVVDKPQGVTSHDVVAAVRSTLHTRKVGHAGTLDPMATGVLVIGFGHATRLLNYIVEHRKTYEATIRLGQTTTTDDADGAVVASVPVTLRNGGLESGSAGYIPKVSATEPLVLTREHIEQTIAEHLTGHIEQVPSTYSAIKIDGKRAYDLARAGEAVELKARSVTIHEFTVTGVAAAQTREASSAVDVAVSVTCSAGTYIRSLGRDLGDLLGVGGHLTKLRRTRVGRFDVNAPGVVMAHAQPHSFMNREGTRVTKNRAVLDAGRVELLAASLTMFDAAKATMPLLEIDDDDARDLRYGRRLHRQVEAISAAFLTSSGEVIALVAPADQGQVKPVVVFPAQ